VRSNILAGVPHSLAFQIAAIVVLTVTLVLTVLGVHFVSTLNRTVGENIEEEARLPGRLINAGMMRMESVADAEAIERLTGTKMLLGMVVGVGGRIYYSSNPDYVGEFITEVLPKAAPKPSFGSTTEQLIRNSHTVTAIIPILGVDRKTPRFYAYTRMSLRNYHRLHTSVLRAVVFGSIGAIVLTSVLILLALRGLVVQPVRSILEALSRIRGGDMNARVRGRMRATEFQALADSVDDVATIRGEAERSLRSAKADAEETSEIKSRFLAGISHELRTPLHGIMGMAGIAESDEITPLQRQALASIRNSAEMLHTVIRNILDFTVLESGERDLDLTDVDLSEVTNEIAGSFDALLRSKGIEIVVRVEPACRFVRADRFRIEQVISNLLSNAVKYTDEGRIEVRALQHDSGVRLQVSDTGIGIAEEHRDSVFESFRQLEDPYTKTRRGLGLGLALVKRVVEIMGGSIAVDESPSGGSVFTIDLPLEVVGVHPVPHEPTEEPEPRTQVSEQPTHPNILVVEDDAINRMYLSSLLGKHGYQVVEAKNGEEAVALSATSSPRLILMDVGLPKLNGIEATREIRRREESANAHTPIVALTAHAYKEDRDRCISAGMDEFLTKPLNESVLLRTISSLTG
jgi:signal transduction histidine kinase/ActR/RegA family two-component response regulator